MVKNFKKLFQSIFSPNQAISSNFGFFNLKKKFQLKKKICQKFQKSFLINFLAISGNFEQLWFFPLLTKKILMQVLRLIEASEAVLEEKQCQQFAASGSCTLSTNEKPRSIVPKSFQPISYRTKIEEGGTEIPVFRQSL